MKCVKLTITSAENDDWNGCWLKKDVEEEMVELDNKPVSEDDWICWILGHMFFTKDGFTDEMCKAVCISGLALAVFSLKDGCVSISKVYE